MQQPSSGVPPKAATLTAAKPVAPIAALPAPNTTAPIASSPQVAVQAPPVAAAPKVVAPVLPSVPKEVWTASVGQTLWKTVSVWTAKSKWTLDWQSPDLDYPIDYPLTFEGTYQDAVEQIFELYADAPRSFTYEGSTALKTLKVCEFKASTYQGKPKCK
ncbi:TcpQ domain-containing protein [Pseudomonas sp. PDM20]|uniref:TcpQ domain-containing protein n=1 Tax=Pseudomonas sp. PDM20 TaxID=2769254 RepID=UPI0017845A87|nr:TcpQ domain-containing protein [Pseudomonas sp. PDM20]MBD9686849.1 TcpQ domain-containing protein [Pseudomonas sp. PDM20]